MPENVVSDEEYYKYLDNLNEELMPKQPLSQKESDKALKHISEQFNEQLEPLKEYYDFLERHPENYSDPLHRSAFTYFETKYGTPTISENDKPVWDTRETNDAITKLEQKINISNLASSYDNARKAAISDTSKELSGYCFPECNNAEITSNLDKLIPKITITQYSTDTFPELFQNFIKGLRGLKKGSFSNNIEDNTLKEIYSKLDSSSNTSLPYSINLLFNSLPTTYKRKISLPITSTPLSINSQLDHGWKANQSLFDFIKKQLGGNSLIGTLFGNFGKTVANGATAITEITENLMHIFGRDIQLGPYWSLGEGALDNRQTLTFNTILVNDSYEHYIANAKVMYSLFVDSQPMALNGSYKINPPDIFDIELDTCVAGKKKYFLCSGQFSCEAKGRYYGKGWFKKVPEAYSLSLTFNSLIPDLLKIQEKYGKYRGNDK